MADADPSTSTSNAATPENVTGGTPLGLDEIKGYLRQKDDTSRFVGLALLKSALDTQPSVRQDEVVLNSLWESISPTFLARLLRAANKYNEQENAKEMVDIAVSVLHIFAILLPAEKREDTKFVSRIDGLLSCLEQCSDETKTRVYETLRTLVNCPAGAARFVELVDKNLLARPVIVQPPLLDIVWTSWVYAASIESEHDKVRKSIDFVMTSLNAMFKGTDAVLYLEFVAVAFSHLTDDVLPLMPRWLDDVLKLIGSLAIKRPTAKGRAAYTRAADAMLTHYHDETASFLFSPPRATKPDEDSKPFNYLFINLLLIDIRSTYPTLLSKLNSPEYKEISRRLQADLSIVTHFIAFLVKSLGSDNDDGDDDGFELIMSADLLLTLRKNIAETVSLTIEYLRDRYDASVAGALGLHPDARAGTSATSEGTRLTLTWENMKDEIPHDRLILACLQMTSLWLREDENENLRAEAAGLTDLLTELYKESSKDGLDFRLPILTTLEATISTTQGIDAFIAHETWQPLINDCTTVAQTALLKSRVSSNDQEAQVGISIIRVLLAAVDDYAITEPPMECMFMVTVAAGLPIIDNISIACLDFEVALVQLAAALLTKASPGLRRQFRESVAALNGLTRQLKELGRRQNDQELLDSLDDVLVELEDLRH